MNAKGIANKQKNVYTKPPSQTNVRTKKNPKDNGDVMADGNNAEKKKRNERDRSQNIHHRSDIQGYTHNTRHFKWLQFARLFAETFGSLAVLSVGSSQKTLFHIIKNEKRTGQNRNNNNNNNCRSDFTGARIRSAWSRSPVYLA